MRKEEKSFRKHPTKRQNQARLLILLLCVSCFLSISACTKYNPAFYPSYDVLNPGEEVKKNPYGTITFLPDGTHVASIDHFVEVEEAYFLINAIFLQHYRELWEEVKKLRKLIKQP